MIWTPTTDEDLTPEEAKSLEFCRVVLEDSGSGSTEATFYAQDDTTLCRVFVTVAYGRLVGIVIRGDELLVCERIHQPQTEGITR